MQMRRDGKSGKTMLAFFKLTSEALANALAHRTWDVDANVRVAMYQDRVEIASP
jgi:hypothetical protein